MLQKNTKKSLFTAFGARSPVALKESPPEKREGSLDSVLVTESIDPLSIFPVVTFSSLVWEQGQKAGRLMCYVLGPIRVV